MSDDKQVKSKEGAQDSLFPLRESRIPQRGKSAFFQERARRRRLYQMLAAFSVGAAAVGVIIGVQGPRGVSPLGEVTQARGEKALSYAELRSGEIGPNAKLYEGAFARIRGEGPRYSEPVVQTEEERDAALLRRQERRAYAGAPPTIPHSIQEKDPSACLACHGEGGRLAGLRIPPMSHQYLTMCTQCHATSRGEHSEISKLGRIGGESSFEGQQEAGQGDRAWEGAPPRIPHAVFMRENCSSCHGRQGEPGLRSTHPERENCQQCHAPASTFDQAGPPAFGSWPPAP